MKRLLRSILLLLVVALLLACNTGQANPAVTTPVIEVDPPDEPTEAPVEKPTKEPTPEEEATETPEPSGAGSLQGVQAAAIQIEAQGTFIDPEFGLQMNSAGAGSGFIIDPSGLAVTNNHVVTGAALLKVYVGGDTDETYNARVLGASECSDLALIDIEGNDFPTLSWYEGDIEVGLDVYAAGFPLGDPEFTLTRGIVSKAETGGDTSWASVDEVIEHDATINPGNSGGPLVDADGNVVGINYAGASETNQYFAIARDEAQALIEELMEGDVTSIGVNGTAVTDGESLAGIWVASVKSGSPADNAGVKAGDIITHLEGLQLALDGSMADYCDILRSRNEDDVMAVTVLRYDTEEVLEGQLNGRELEVSFSFATELEEEAGGEPGTGGDLTEGSYTEYVPLSDDTGQLQLEVPAEWSDTNGSAWVMDDTDIGVAISAAPDLESFNSTWETPGVFFGASTVLIEQGKTEESLLDEQDFSESCSYTGREPYADALYTGFYDLWENCGGGDTLFLVLTAVPEDRAFMALIQVQVVSDADLEALDSILNSFVVTGDLTVASSGDSGGSGDTGDTGGDGDTSVSTEPMVAGNCFNLDDAIGDTELTDCAAPHDYEVFGVFNYPAEADAPFPSEEELETYWDAECRTAFAAYVGIAYDDSALYMSALEPTEESWAGGDREILCVLYEPDVQLEGSMQGAQR